MKKNLFFLLAISLSTFVFSGCKKVKEALQYDIGFTTKVVEFTMPAVPIGLSTTLDVPAEINLDSVLHASGVSLDKVKKIQLEKIELHQTNGSSTNNLDVISHVRVELASESKTEFVEVANLPDNVLPMADPYQMDIPGNKNLDLKPYFQSTHFTYRISAGLREPTLEEKECTVWTRYIITVGG